MARSQRRWSWGAAVAMDTGPTGGSGGGAIRLTVGGVLQVDGRVTANGTNGSKRTTAAVAIYYTRRRWWFGR